MVRILAAASAALLIPTTSAFTSPASATGGVSISPSANAKWRLYQKEPRSAARPLGGPASSAEEDLALTRAIILQHIGEDDANSTTEGVDKVSEASAASTAVASPESTATETSTEPTKHSAAPAAAETAAPMQMASTATDTPSMTTTTMSGMSASTDMSLAIPFVARPALLDGTLPGDAGFDPFGFAGPDMKQLMFMREAEIKHARLAMLCAAGWPIAELMDKPLASAFGLEPALTSTGQSPSLLNGGMDKIANEYWIMVIALAGIFELQSQITKSKMGEDYIPGACGFDPLGLLPDNDEERYAMQTKEIKNGRLAMMAVLGFVVQEVLYNQPVVAETPMFFRPFFM